MSTNGMARTTIYINEFDLNRFKQMCRDSGGTVTSVIRSYIETELEKYDEVEKAKKKRLEYDVRAKLMRELRRNGKLK